MQKLVGPYPVDRMGSIKPLDFCPVTDFQFSLVEKSHFAELVGHPFVDADSVKMTAFDHEWAGTDQIGHFCIVEGTTQIPFKDLVLACPHVAETMSRGSILANPLIKVSRTNGQTVTTYQRRNPHGTFATVGESVEGNPLGVDKRQAPELIDNLLVLRHDR